MNAHLWQVKAKVRGPNDATDARMDDAAADVFGMSHGNLQIPLKSNIDTQNDAMFERRSRDTSLYVRFRGCN